MNITRRGFLQSFGAAIAAAAATPLLPQTKPPVASLEVVKPSKVVRAPLTLRNRIPIIDGLDIIEWKLDCHTDYRVSNLIGGEPIREFGRRHAELYIKAYFDNPGLYIQYLHDEPVTIEKSEYPGLEGKWMLVRFEIVGSMNQGTIQELHFLRVYS